MRLIITRHGETEENVQGISQGNLPGKLTEKGIEQAKKVAERLKEEKIDHIYSSDLARAADIAKEIVKFHPDVPLEFVEELRERYVGEFQGRKKSEFGLSKEKTTILHLLPKDGETLDELYDRANKFLHKVLHQHKEDTVLFVAHN